MVRTLARTLARTLSQTTVVHRLRGANDLRKSARVGKVSNEPRFASKAVCNLDQRRVGNRVGWLTGFQVAGLRAIKASADLTFRREGAFADHAMS